MKALVLILALMGSMSAQAVEIVQEYSCVEKSEGLWSFSDKKLALRVEYYDENALEAATINGAEVDLLNSKSVQFFDARNERIISIDIKNISDAKVVDSYREKGGYGTSYVTQSFDLSGSIIIDRIHVQDAQFSCKQTTYSIDK